MNYSNCFLWRCLSPDYTLDLLKKEIEDNDEFSSNFYEVFNQVYSYLSYEMIDYLFDQDKINFMSTYDSKYINNKEHSDIVILYIYPFVWYKSFYGKRISNSIYITYKIMCLMNKKNAFYKPICSFWNGSFIKNVKGSLYSNFFTFIKKHDGSEMHPALKMLARNEKRRLKTLSENVFKQINKIDQ